MTAVRIVQGAESMADTVMQQWRNHAYRLNSQVEENGNFVDNFIPSDPVMLPVGIKKSIAGWDYTIILDSLRFGPQFAMADAYLIIEAGLEEPLAFGGKGFQITYDGGISGPSRIYLIGDYPIKRGTTQVKLSGANPMVPNQNELPTFAEFDCSGFQSLGITAKIQLSESFKTENGLPVEASVYAEAASLEDIILGLSLPSFHHINYPDFRISVNQAFLDMSDLRNPVNTNLTPYLNTLEHPLYQLNPTLWKGIFIKEASVTLPAFNDNMENTSLVVQNLLLDEYGLTGRIGGENIIQNDQVNGWGFSLDQLFLEFYHDRVNGAGFSGFVTLPVADTTRIRYTGIILPESNYVFQLQLDSEIDFPAFGPATATLDEHSTIQIEFLNGSITTEAMLHGSLKFDAFEVGDNNIDLPDLTFQNLYIVGDEIRGGNFSLGNSAGGLGVFPFQLENVEVMFTSQQVRLGFDLNLQLTSSDNNAIGGNTRLELVSTRSDNRYIFDGAEINEVAINASMSAFHVSGNLIMFDQDPIYGKGFRGNITVDIQPLSIAGEAQMLVGNVDNLRYWNFDLLLIQSGGVPITPNFSLYGIGGGAFRHMDMKYDHAPNAIGTFSSGNTYIPDAAIGFGFRANILLGHPNIQAFNAYSSLEMAFRKNGGLSRITFTGIAHLLQQNPDISVEAIQSMNTSANNTNSAISGSLFMEMNIENREFHANIDAIVNVAGGIIRGIGPGGYAGRMVMHFDPQQWYIYVGEPENRIGLQALGVGQLSGYFVIGSVIPPMPALDQRFLQNGMEPMRLSSNDPVLISGSGFGFGANMTVQTPELEESIVFAQLILDAGFDIHLQQYNNVICQNTGQSPGMNGWYAQGQAYMYIMGDFGLNLTLFGEARKIVFARIESAVVAQAMLPNPSYFTGNLFLSYNVMNGLVTGNVDFNFEYGDACVMQTNDQAVLDEIEIIASITPADQDAEVSIFSVAQLVFNYAIDYPFGMGDDTYRFHLNRFDVKSNGNILPGTITFSEDGRIAVMKTEGSLPPEQPIELYAELVFEKKTGNTWAAVQKNGEPVTTVATTTFTTAAAPNHVAQENIMNTFPYQWQYNAYPGSAGYIELRYDQNYLFEQGYQYVVEWKQGGISYTTSLRNEGKKIHFDIPPTLNNGIPVEFEFVKKASITLDALDKNVVTTSTAIELNDAGGNLTLNELNATSTLEDEKDQILYTGQFRVSDYGSPEDKLEALMEQVQVFRRPVYTRDNLPTGVFNLDLYITLPEKFDAFDLGNYLYNALLQINLDPEDPYFDALENTVYRYQNISKSAVITHRDANLPLTENAISLHQTPDNITFTQPDEMNTAQSRITIDLFEKARRDLMDIQNGIKYDYSVNGVLTQKQRQAIESEIPAFNGRRLGMVFQYRDNHNHAFTSIPVSVRL